MKDNEDNVITNSKGIMKNIHDFYSNLYSSSNIFNNNVPNNIENIFDNITIPKLHEDDKKRLDSPLSKKELFEVITSMNFNKTPGFDGLPVEFYVAFWPDISDLLLDSFNFSLRNGSMSASQRNGIITLLPKKDKDPLFIKNYRPITLLTTDYKILAKCLANRLKRCLHDLIHPDQSGFLKGRYIGDNIRLILDIIEYTDCNDIPGSIILLDIEKAFDSVSHDFLFKTLEQFNFGSTFINSVKTLYSARQSYVVNNGFLTEHIKMGRGIFQGCPISPYLFLFVIEIMALMIRQNDQIIGIPVGDQEAKISLFADDSVCFLDGSDNSFIQLFNTLHEFGLYSGCKININKTEAIWIGSKKDSQHIPPINRGITWKANQFKCLGVNLSLNVSSIFDLNYKIKLKRIKQTINCWRLRNLSLIGKVCVIKTLILPQLIYIFQFFVSKFLILFSRK